MESEFKSHEPITKSLMMTGRDWLVLTDPPDQNSVPPFPTEDENKPLFL
jgi:hypothetical protein